MHTFFICFIFFYILDEVIFIPFQKTLNFIYFFFIQSSNVFFINRENNF